jgi:hypothetical protein
VFLFVPLSRSPRPDASTSVGRAELAPSFRSHARILAMWKPVGEGKCRPLILRTSGATEAPRIGGLPPTGVHPRFSDGLQKYFGTFGFLEDKEISIFYSLDPHGFAESRDMISHNNQILFESPLIHTVIHDRQLMAPKADDIPAFGMLVEDEIDDEPPHAAGSKIGGSPFADNEAALGNAFQQLLSSGFVQLLQLDTPNPRLYPGVGEYPWDPGWLHVFYRMNSASTPEFAFVIQQ